MDPVPLDEDLIERLAVALGLEQAWHLDREQVIAAARSAWAIDLPASLAECWPPPS